MSETTEGVLLFFCAAASDAVNGNLTPADADRITLAAGRILRAYKQSGLKA